MFVLDPGHRYTLRTLDGQLSQILTFVKREGEGFPGNVGHHPGTTVQEVCRALIDRVFYCNNQLPHPANDATIKHLREVIQVLEERERAAERHGGHMPKIDNDHDTPIEELTPCLTCGHVFPHERNHEVMNGKK